MNGKLTLAGILLALPLSAMAMPIDGSIFLGGLGTTTCGEGAPCDWTVDSQIDFGSNGYNPGTLDGSMIVTNATGDFAPAFLFIGAIDDFDFTNVPPSIDPLWSVFDGANTWSFRLDSVTINDRLTDFVDLSGMGTLMSTDANLDDTLGFWSFSMDTSDPTNTSFQWSSTNFPVAEPGILLVFGAGLLGLAAARRFRR